jgi:hypothetical protein
MLQTDEVTFFAAISRVAIKSQNYKNINFCDLTPYPPSLRGKGGNTTSDLIEAVNYTYLHTLKLPKKPSFS